MRNRMIFLFALPLLALGLAACVSQNKPIDESSLQDMATQVVMPANSADQPGSMETPAWFDASLTNASSGETFTINDFAGKVVLVETFAQWCTNCLQQQKQVVELHTSLGERDDFISLGLDIDPNENVDMLKKYLDQHGFNWLYSIAPPEVSNEIASLYGDQFLNPTSTPMLIVDRHGEAHPLPFGIKSAAELEQALQPYLDEGM
jgi:cytochrome oxidase Cu insertion factor (SCO1/SenC/PrrC family)